MKEPLTCLERVRSVTSEVAVIETEAVHVQGLEDTDQLLQFYAGGEVNNDFGNWFIPTMTALHALCLAAGFSSVRTIQGPPPRPVPGRRHPAGVSAAAGEQGAGWTGLTRRHRPGTAPSSTRTSRSRTFTDGSVGGAGECPGWRPGPKGVS